MKMVLKVAAVAAALTMFVSVAAEAQGGGGGARGGGRAGGGGRGGMTGMLTADGVTADSAYTVLMAGITLDAAKKGEVIKLITKYQADLRANPAPARGGGARGGGAGGGGMDSATMAAMQAATAKRNEITTTFRTEVKKHLNTEQGATFDATFPQPGARRGGGGGAPQL